MVPIRLRRLSHKCQEWKHIERHTLLRPAGEVILEHVPVRWLLLCTGCRLGVLEFESPDVVGGEDVLP